MPHLGHTIIWVPCTCLGEKTNLCISNILTRQVNLRLIWREHASLETLESTLENCVNMALGKTLLPLGLEKLQLNSLFHRARSGRSKQVT